MSKRAASHAGSWYSDEPKYLAKQFKGWMEDVKVDAKEGVARAVIVPHAGYTYCGKTASHAFKHVNPATVKRVFVLGPSHHYPTRTCMLTSCATWETPFGDVAVDQKVQAALKETGKFDIMDKDIDEEEHSMEMELPFLMYLMNGKEFTLVPIMVGNLSTKSETEFGQIFAPYLNDPDNLFVISSDFCHWGDRFDYTYYDSKQGKVWQSIEDLDRKGMTAIESLKPDNFVSYLNTYANTICGRHAITLFMHSVQKSNKSHHCKFVHYSQSSKAQRISDSSVSYAGGVFFLDAPKEKEQSKSNSTTSASASASSSATASSSSSATSSSSSASTSESKQ